jgi:tetratricopeptide (TPR) repeat protein
VLERLPQTRETLEQAVDVRIDLRNSLFPLGEHAAIHDHVLEAERIASRLADPRRLGWVSALMAHYFWRTGEHERAASSGERALALSATTGDLALRVSAQYYLGLAFMALGRYTSAMEVLDRNLDVLQGDLLRERFGMTGLPSVFCRTWWAWCAAETGRFETGLARATEGLRIAEAADHPYSLVFGCRGVSHIHMARGDLEAAIVFLERGLALCRTWGFPTLLAGVAPSLGSAYALSGHVEEGLALLEPAVALATERNLKFSLSLWLSHLSRVYLLAGRAGEAYDAAVRALALARECRERGHEAWALGALADIAVSGAAAAADAETLFGEALGIADELGMQPLAARCRLGLGSVLRRRGRGDAAEAELRAARDLFESLGMSSSLARTERELLDR